MKTFCKRPVVWAVLPLVVVAFISVILGSASRPLADREDAVIVAGKELPGAFLGAPTGKYRLFAQSGSNLDPIPFQIDERNDKGVILMQKGLKAAPDSDNGAFDGNDELVFMAWDTGLRFSGKPAVAGCESFCEIAVTDSKTNTVAYAYLAKCSNPPAPSPKRYVQWDEAKRTAITESYRFGWQRAPVFYYDTISIFGGPNVLDRLKVRLIGKVGGIQMVFTEQNFKPDIYGYINGPVRAVFYDNSKLTLGPLGGIPGGQFNYFYRDYMYMRNLIDLRFNPAVIGLDYTIEFNHDLNIDRSKGYKVCAESLPDCLTITGHPTPEELEIAKKELHWGGIQGPDGAVITRIVIAPDLPLKVSGVYVDDEKANRKPEYLPGSNPEIGFLTYNWRAAGKGVFYLDFYDYFMKKFSRAELARYDNVIFNPLKVKAVAARQ